MTSKLVPSKVFGSRLRETRKARRISQTALAQRMTDVGRPLDKAAVLRIENGERRLSLDEAIAFASVLNAVPANMLTPPDDEFLAVTDNVAIDGEALRSWLVTGSALPGWPQHMPGTPEDRLRLDALLEDRVAAYAQALVDADRAADLAGTKAAVIAIRGAVLEHRAAIGGNDA